MKLFWLLTLVVVVLMSTQSAYAQKNTDNNSDNDMSATIDADDDTNDDADDDANEDADDDTNQDAEDDANDDADDDTNEDENDDTNDDTNQDADGDTNEDADDDTNDDTNQDADDDTNEDADDDTNDDTNQDGDGDTNEDADNDTNEDADDDTNQDAEDDANDGTDDDTNEDENDDTNDDTNQDADGDTSEDADDDTNDDTNEDADDDTNEDADDDTNDDTNQDADGDTNEDADNDTNEDADDDTNDDADDDTDSDADEDADEDTDDNTNDDADDDANEDVDDDTNQDTDDDTNQDADNDNNEDADDDTNDDADDDAENDGDDDADNDADDDTNEDADDDNSNDTDNGSDDADDDDDDDNDDDDDDDDDDEDDGSSSNRAVDDPNDYCENCKIQGSYGYASFPGDCTCFYICVLQTEFKNAHWVAHKRCCPCGTAFSHQLLTCVDYRHKAADCYDAESQDDNPCSGRQDGDLVPRSNEDDPNPDAILCSGFHRCTQVGDILLPESVCCPPGECFGYGTCSLGACDSEPCASLRPNKRADCQCTRPPERERECPFQAVEDNIYKFRGVENMIVYTCPDGTCWDADVCTCVKTSLMEVENQCPKFLSMNFENPNSPSFQLATDGQGHDTWADAVNVDINGGVASFDGVGDSNFINVVGLSNSYISNTFIMHFTFTLKEDDSSSNDETQCIVGNCIGDKDQDSPEDDSSISVTIERDSDSSSENIDILLTYQDQQFLSMPDSMETVLVEVEGDYELDIPYDFWLLYFGDDGDVVAGVFDDSNTIIGQAISEVEDSRQIVSTQSGFIFGDCLLGDDFEGEIDNVELWRTCKPFEDIGFSNAATMLGVAD